MEVTAMWLDRLPLNKDVLYQYIFTKKDFMTKQMDTYSKDQFIKMTANTVEFIWKEAEVPSINSDLVEKAVVKLLRDAYEQLDGAEPSQNCDIYDLYVQYTETEVENNPLQLLLEGEEMNLLFDISLLEEAQSNHFYRDQQTARKLKNENRLGQKSLHGNDVYYWRIGKPKFSIAGLTQHYQLSLEQLPTQLDVIKYVNTKTAFRKMSYSAGLWSAYNSIFSVIAEAVRMIHYIWSSYVDSSLLICAISLNDRVKKLIEELTDRNKSNSCLAPIQTDGVGRFHKFDNDSYIRFFLECYDQQVFSALRAGTSTEVKKTSALKENAFKETDVEVEEIIPGPLIVPNFESLLQTSDFDALSWVSGDRVSEIRIEDCDTTGVIVEDLLSAADHEEVTASHAREASTQTTCAHTCSHACFHQL